MSIEAVNWALSQCAGSPSAKSVLLVLANRADQHGRCWPGIDGISEQTELARRTVIAKIKELQLKRLLCVEHRGGTGEGRKSNVYLLHIGAKCKSCTLGLSANGGKQCATDDRLSAAPAPEPSINHQKNPQKSRARKKATRIPDDFALTAERRLVAETEKLSADRTFAKFRDYWLAASGAKARKHDWDATWRNWCRNEADRFGAAGKSTSQKPSYSEGLYADMASKGMLDAADG